LQAHSKVFVHCGRIQTESNGAGQNVPNIFKSRCIVILSQGILFANRYVYFD